MNEIQFCFCLHSIIVNIELKQILIQFEIIQKVQLDSKDNLKITTIKDSYLYKQWMKFSQLKCLIQQGKLLQFEQQLQRQQLVAADYNLLLRELIKNKSIKITPLFSKLIKKGADVNFAHIGGNKKNNLMVACEEGNAEAVELLCAHPKIDFDSEDSMKKTAPFYAIENKNKNDAQLFLDKLLTHAPHLTNQPANNQTMLILAIKKQKPQLVRILLNHNAQPNYIIADSGNTPLHQALKMCKNKETRANKDIARLLIEFGADPDIKNKKNKNCYQFAEKFPLPALIAEIPVKPKTQQLRNILPKQDTKTNIQQDKSKSPKQDKQAKKVSPQPAGEMIQRRESKQNREDKENRKKLFTANTQNQINELIRRANLIYDSQINRIQPPQPSKAHLASQLLSQDQDQDKQDSVSQSSQEEDQDITPYRKSEQITQQLTAQIQRYEIKCQQVYRTAQKQFQKFYHRLCQLAYNQNLNVQLCGSFCTGLWIKNCDIDILLVPQDQFIAENNPNYIDNILNRFEMILKCQPSIKVNSFIKNKKIRVPMLRLDIEFPHANGKSRKVDITVFDRNHNGMAIAHYISENTKIFPHLKPLFFTIKSLTYHFKLNDPKNGGIRTYALVIMIISFLNSERMKGFNIETIPLGQLLLRFLHFFGFEYQYGYAAGGELKQDLMCGKIEPFMVLTIYDPLNHSNNLGKNAKAYELQHMFKAAYIGLHSNIKQEKLEFMFALKKICIF